MYDIGQNPFYSYSVHRTSVSGERSIANGSLVSKGLYCRQVKTKACLGRSYNRVENIVGKRKCWLSVLSPFPTMFPKAIFPRVVISLSCMDEGEGTSSCKMKVMER